MADRKPDPLRIKLKNVRLSYPHLYRAKAFGDNNEGEPKFNATFLMDPESKEGRRNIEIIEDAIDHAIKEKWPKSPPKLSSAKKCLRSGDDLEEVKEGYEGMMYLSASETKRPRVLDADGEDVRDGEEGAPYAGCRVDVIARIWAQDNKFGKRINCGLIAVKFRDDDEPFGGAAPFDASEFDDDDDDRGSRGRSRSRDDDDDDKPRGRRGRDDDDEKPRSRSRSRDDDDDDDEKPRSRSRSRDDDDDDEKPRSRSRSRDDDDEKPRSRRGRDEDDEDEKPSRRRSSREDDDEDEKPSRRRSSREDDDEDEKPRTRRSSRRDTDV